MSRLGALLLGEGGGAKYSSPCQMDDIKWVKNHEKSMFLKIDKEHPRASRTTPENF